MTVTPTAVPATVTIRRVGVVGGGVRMLGNETIKGLRVMWVHKLPLLLQLAMMATSYWIVQAFIGGGRLVGEVMAMTLPGYLAYVVGYVTLLRMVAGVLEEMYTGTLEQSLLSPLPPWVQSTGRLAAALVEAVLTGLVVLVAFVAVVVVGLDVNLAWRWSAVVPVAVTLADIAGFALLLGGVALVVNSIGAIVHVIQGFVMMFNGGFVPVFVFPDWLETTAKIVVPTTLGSDAVRQTLIEGASLGQIWSNGTLAAATVHAAVLLSLGWTTYQAAIRRGLRGGRLGA